VVREESGESDTTEMSEADLEVRCLRRRLSDPYSTLTNPDLAFLNDYDPDSAL